MAKKIKPESLLELTFVADPQLSPDGKKSLAVLTRILPGKDDEPPKYRSRIHLFDQGGTSRPFTQAEADSSSPRWSPDGAQVALLSKRGDPKGARLDKPQLFVMPAAGGEAERRTELKDGVRGFAWRPDGLAIALVSRGDWEDEDAKRGLARVIDRLHYKANGVGFRPKEPAQLYLLELAAGKCKRLTQFKTDVGEPAWAPDGTTLYFTAARDTAEADDWRSRLWRLTPGGEAEEVMKEGPTRVSAPQPSPSGERIAFFANADDNNFATPTGLWTVRADGGEVTLHTDELEAVAAIAGDSRYGLYPNRAAWQDDDRLLFNANARGRSGLHKLELATGTIKPLQKGDRAVTSFSYAGGVFSFTAETPETPGELFLRARGRERRLSRLNDDFLATYRIAQVSKEAGARSKDGTRVPYWTLLPDKPRKDGALVLQVHGGPHTDYGYGFMLEFQLLASQGYTVVYGNPRGSSSYGLDYTTTMQGRYGSIDAEDLLAVAKQARKRHADPGAPIHLTGGSYGGFMTNWLVSHSDMFRSAVTQRCISNWLSFYGSSDIGYRFTEQEVGGNAWDDSDRLWAQSPLKYVARIRTPLLIIHADEDHRCPVEQAEQLFVALKRIGKAATRLIRFPEENHELSRSGRPDRRIQRLEAIVDWFKAHA